MRLEMKKKLLLIGILLVSQPAQAGFFSSIGDAFSHAFHEVYNGISYASREAFAAVKHIAEEAAAALEKAVEEAVNAVKDLEQEAAGQLISGLKEASAETMSSVSNFAQQAIAQAKEGVKAAANATKDAAEVTVQKAKDGVESAVNTLKEKAEEAANLVKNAANTVGDAVTKAADSVADAAVDSANVVNDAVNTAVDAAVSTATDAYDKSLKVAYDKTKGGIEKGIAIIKAMIHPPNPTEEKIEALQGIVDGVKALQAPVNKAVKAAIAHQATLKIFLDTQLTALVSGNDIATKSFGPVIPGLQNTFSILTEGNMFDQLKCPSSAPCAAYLDYLVNMVEYIFAIIIQAVEAKIAPLQGKPIPAKPVAPTLPADNIIANKQKEIAKNEALTKLVVEVQTAQKMLIADYAKAFTGFAAFKNFFVNVLPRDVSGQSITKTAFIKVIEAMNKVEAGLIKTYTVGKSTLPAYSLMGCPEHININALTIPLLPAKYELSKMSNKCQSLQKKIENSFNGLFSKIIEVLQSKMPKD
jgi:hypothetical protein